jgi:hypothetical protein
MNEPVIETPAGRPAPAANPASRMIGVITAPASTFEEVAKRPSWVAPLVIYIVAFMVVFTVFSMRADWVAILTEQIEKSPFMSMMNDTQREQAVRGATAELAKMTPVQQTLNNLINYPPGFMFFYHVLALIYATLFVMMGSLPKLELGKAWVNLLVCLLLFVAQIAIFAVSRFAFRDAIESRLMLTGLGAVAVSVAWIWLLGKRAAADGEFHRVLAVCTTSTAVPVVGMLAWLAVTLVTPTPITTPPEQLVKAHLGALVQTGVPALQKLLESFDVFYLWWFIVMTIGFRVITRLSTGVAAAITFLPYGIVVLIKVAWAAVFG